MDETTIPPVKRKWWKEALATGWVWLQAHPNIGVLLAAVMSAFFLGRCTA